MSLDVPENIVHHDLGGAQGPVKVELKLETLACTKR